MGVVFDRVLEGVEGPFEKIKGPARLLPGKIAGSPNPAGYILDHRTNDSFIAVNRLLKQGEEVYWIKSPLTAGGRDYPPGAEIGRAHV